MKNEDIEILDLDEEVIYTKNEVVAPIKVIDKRRKNNKTTINVENMQKLKEINDVKKNKKFGIGEKAFLTFSILFILGCFAFYGYRTYYYYHLTHDVVKNITLKEKLTGINNITYQNDGLYENDGYFYYKGSNVNNYVYYSGRLFRIIDINDGIHMIENETLTNLIWKVDSNYENSSIYKWLNNYLSTLKDYERYLKKSQWCNEQIDLNNYECNNTISSYVGLLSTKDYLKAGGKNSYLNNETYFWTINEDLEGNPLYVNSEGNINNLYKKDDNYFSYGIRPVITLNDDTIIISGDGSKNSPFIIEELGNALLKVNSIGSYVKYYGDVYQILNIDDDGISLIYDGVLDREMKYDDVIKYLNNEFIKKYNKDDLVMINYNVSEYSLSNKYNIDNKNNKKNYVTIPNIGDMFLNKYNNYWLNNYSDNKLGLYYILDENHMFFADLKSNTHQIRPIIKLNIETVVSSGLGTKDEPLIIGEEGDMDAKENKESPLNS